MRTETLAHFEMGSRVVLEVVAVIMVVELEAASSIRGLVVETRRPMLRVPPARMTTVQVVVEAAVPAGPVHLPALMVA